MWPHRRQPTRLLCPWNSPGNNTGVGCHFLLQCMLSHFSRIHSVWPHGQQPTRLLCPRKSLGKSTGVGYHFLLHIEKARLLSQDLLLLLSHFSHVQPCATPLTAAHLAISFSSAWKWKVKMKSLSRVWLFVTPWTAAYQRPPSMGFPDKSTGVGCHCLLHEFKRYGFKSWS